MHRQNLNSRGSQQNQVQEFNYSQDQQVQQHQQYSQQRISRTEQHTVSRQVTQQRGQLMESFSSIHSFFGIYHAHYIIYTAKLFSFLFMILCESVKNRSPKN